MSEPTWELLGGGGTVGGPIDYVGAWAAGTQYQPGQVVRHNGVDYLAVNPSLGQTPPLAVSGLVPLPIVNGQWVKGVGGAAVWADITGADIKGPQVPIKLLGGYVSATAFDGGWHYVTNDAVFSASTVVADDLIGPSGVYKQHRFLSWFYCTAVGASADFTLAIALGRPYIDNGWVATPGWRPTRTAGAHSSYDNGWQTFAAAPGLRALTLQYQANYAGGPLSGVFGASLWVR